MEFVFKLDTFIVDNPISLKYIHFASEKFAYSVIVGNFWRKNYIYGGYFEVSNDGSVHPLVKFEMDLILNRYVPYYEGSVGDGNYRYIPEGKYYMHLAVDEPTFNMKESNHFFYKTFPDHKKEISDFIKRNDTNLHHKKVLIQLFEYINSVKK